MRKILNAGLIGCGGRGTGAAENWLQAAKDVRIVALADVFADRLAGSRAYLEGMKHDGVRLSDERCFVGFDAYRRLLALEDVDVVLLAPPPGFRPLHFEAAVAAGKHCFVEKPIAVDPVGVRRFLAAGRQAAEKGLAVVAGTQYRHQEGFQEVVRRVREGWIGEIREARVFYNGGPVPHHARQDGWTDMEDQIRNWWYYDWLSGDCIVEQHIHTIDVGNWLLGAHPVRATGSGGRIQRVGEGFGNGYDHFAIDFEYAGGIHCLSMNRQWAGSDGYVGAWVRGTEGVARPYEGVIEGARPWRYEGASTLGTAYVQEHADLIASIRAGKPANESAQVAESTLTAIMGRQAAYTGRTITWQEMTESDLDYSPAKHEFGPLDVRRVPVPGSE